MFQNLSDKLTSAFKQLKGEGRINELNIANTVKDIRKALLDADVNYKIAKEFTDKVKEKALGQKVLSAVSPGQLMIKIVKDELTELMGGSESNLNIAGNPAIILISGLQDFSTWGIDLLVTKLSISKDEEILSKALDVIEEVT